jgi:hypothetical protein
VKGSLLTAIALSSLSLATLTGAQSQPPKLFVDKGACPFECCTYRKWKTEKTTVAYEQPNKRSKQIGKFVAGQTVRALTGEVRTVPSRFIVKHAQGKYKIGDVLWVYTYLGEGHFKVWFNGRLYDEGLDVGTNKGGDTRNCDEDKTCFGELDRDVRMTWWVKIKSPAGWIGWTNEPDNFSGADSCG